MVPRKDTAAIQSQEIMAIQEIKVVLLIFQAGNLVL